MDESTPSGIEATDLASLLCRFEEATSADDLNIPVSKKKKDIILKAKSAGNSPGPTPPGTPPPHVNNVIINRKLAVTAHPSSKLRKSYTTARTHAVVPPSYQPENESSVTSAFTPLANKAPVVPVQIHQVVTTAGLQTQVQGKPSNSSLASLLQGKQVLYLKPATQFPGPNSLQGVSRICASLLRPPVPQSIPIIISDKSNLFVTRTSTTSSMPQTSSVAHTSQSTPTSASCCASQQLSRSSHDSRHVSNPAIVTKLAQNETSASQVLKDIDANVLQTSVSSIENLKSTQPKVQLDAIQNEAEDDSDHNYCFSMKDELHQNDAPEEYESARANSSEQLSVFSLTTGETQPQLSGDGATSVLNNVDIGSDFLTKDSQPSHDTLGNQRPSPLSVPNEFVFEEGEIIVDADGNDSLPQHVSWSCGNEDSNEEHNFNRTVTFKSAERGVTRKRLHRYRQRAEYSTSPIREDTADFFDKIPSYYTALSIPSKPMTTSVFASATKAIGSTDHLELLESGEQEDEGHFDKVPAHRRCFTNTAKDVEIEHSSVQDFSKEDMSPTCLGQSHLASSSRSDPSDSDYYSTAAHSNSQKSYSSHVSERRARSISRRSRSGSRYSDRSASSGSYCSTCSYRSRSCSTCSGSSRSRSRSASCSESERDSDYMRSRSRSPGACRDMKMRGRRSRHRFTPQRHEASRSRTRSPAERAGWRSRSHTHRRRRYSSSTDTKVLERRKAREEEKVKAMEERRVVYVGKIPDGYTKRQLHQRFQCFGEIKEVKVNFREHGDNYGFVTFAYACDAIAAKEKGNNVPGAPKFDLCFGGRRRFCPDEYADLDGNREIEEEYAPMPKNLTEELDYAALLRQHSIQQKKKAP